MKIICIGRNYVEHAKELGNAIPEKPLIFIKPDTALLKDNEPFYYPDFSQSIHYECELVYKIDKVGKNIDKKFASKYYSEVALGIDFTARDLQQECKDKSWPWEISKGFDNSAAVSKFIPLKELPNQLDIHFELSIDEVLKQQGESHKMMYNIDDIIAYVSKFFTLKTGDLIFTGTPAGVGEIQIGNRLKGTLENKLLLDFEIK